MRTGRKPIPKLLWGRALLLTALLTLSCSHKEESILWLGPNWTSEGKIVFVEERTIFTKHWSVGGGYHTVDDYIVTLYQIDKDGSNLTPIADLSDYIHATMNTSTSATDSLIIVSTGLQMALVERKTGKLLKDLGPGAYADFSPDGKKIVYQKYEGDQPKGIWIMDLESGEERCLVPDTNAMYPSWSSEGGRIALNIIPEWWEGSAALLVVDTLGDLVFRDSTDYYIRRTDWSPAFPGTIAGIKFFRTEFGGFYRFALLNLDSLNIDTIPGIESSYCKWSPDGDWFIGYDENGYFVIKKDGSYKLYLTPGGG